MIIGAIHRGWVRNLRAKFSTELSDYDFISDQILFEESSDWIEAHRPISFMAWLHLHKRLYKNGERA